MTKNILVSLVILTVSTSAALAAQRTHRYHPMNANAAMGPAPMALPGDVNSNDYTMYMRNLHDSGYNPKNDFNPDGTMRAAIQEPGAFAFYYPNLDVLNGGEPTPAAKASPDWPALKGACASAGGGITYCGDRGDSYASAPGAFPRLHARRHHRS